MDAEGLYPAEQKDLNYRPGVAEKVDQMLCGQIGQMLNVDPRSVEIRHDAKGAPYLPLYPSLHISKSYTDRYSVCAVSTERVGIDAERMRTPNPYLARQFFCPEELTRIYDKPVQYDSLPQTEDPQICRRWTRAWTVKEAYGKYHGEGLSAVRRSSLPTQTACTVRSLHILDVVLEGEYCCTVISRISGAQVIQIKCKSLLEQMQQMSKS